MASVPRNTIGHTAPLNLHGITGITFNLHGITGITLNLHRITGNVCALPLGGNSSDRPTSSSQKGYNSLDMYTFTHLLAFLQ